jgi:hypothetical protein
MSTKVRTLIFQTGKQGPDVKGTIFGVAVELTSSIGVEFGTEKSNTADKASYMRLTTTTRILCGCIVYP